MTRLHTLLLLIAALLALFTPLHAKKLTPEEKQHLKDEMHAADKKIHFIKESQVDVVTRESGVKVVFFGAQWCRYTQAFTPKWLEVQQQVDEDQERFGNVRMAKVDCTETYKDPNSLCHKTYQKYEGFPTVLIWVDGTPKGEYPDEDEAPKLLNYIKSIASSYRPKVEEKPAPAPAPAPVVESKPEPAPQAKKPVNFKAEQAPQPVADNVSSESTAQPSESDSSSTVAPILVFILVAGVVGLAVIKYRAAQSKKRGFPVSSSRYDGFSSHRESLLLWDAGNAIDKVA
ncbi:hypothetical protein HK097_010181 [Rhizophlyctis rosea]|uniref:Thioredoxin domain-containing protein n=1 Tax=Rhizophlyctis rosea TaxID=64517 RepID=A0AAD5SAB4_9FUNG|nr:hypothetical protein HK097_010181 [Rhizophlyctis rosea]